MTNAFFDSTIPIIMDNKEIIKFLHQLIAHRDISVEYEQSTTRYYIDMESGSMICIECSLAADENNRPAYYYAVMLDDDVVMESYCLHNAKKHTQQTKQLMELVRKCSNKVIYQEMRARKAGALQQITTTKTIS